MSRAHLLGGPRTLPAPPPPEPSSLVQVDISASFFPASTPAGTMIATLSPPPQAGETRAFNPATTSSDAVYFGVDGAIYRGSGTPFAGDYTVRQTLTGATNTPLDTTWTVTTYTPANLATVGVTPEWNGTSNMGGVQPTPTVFNPTDPNAVKNRFVQLAHSDHETMTGDLILGFVGEGPITVWFGGNSVEITDISVQDVRDPRDGVMRPQLGYFCKALKPAANTGKIVYYATSAGDGENETTTIGPFECYPRASAYDTLLKIAYTAHVDATPGYTGIGALGAAFQYKATHTSETVWIEILDDPPIGWKFGEATPNYNNATTYTKVFGTAGHVAKIGDFSMAYLQPGIDGIEWGENTEWQLAAMGPSGSQPMRLVTPGRFRLWGTRFSCVNPGAHSANWSGDGSSALYKRRQPSGFAVYPNGDPTLIMHAGFCNIEDVPAFGLPCVHLALYNDGSDVSGSFFENQFGAVLHNTIRRVGGRQSGLRGYTPAFRITVNRTTYPYVAIEKTPANGNVILGSPGEPLKLSIPLTIDTAGSGYTDGIFDASSLPGHSPRLAVTGGSGDGSLLVDAIIVGGSLSKAYISKSTLMGAGYKTGDVLTIVQPGVTPTTPATIKLGSTWRIYGGADAATAPIIGEMLLYEGMSHLDVVALFNSLGPGISAASLNPAHDLDVSFLIYDAQPAAGVPTASVIASNIPKRTWTGSTFDLALGVDIHSNNFVNAYTRFNIITQYNRGLDYAESAPISFGRASKPHWLFTHNELYDSTADEYPSLAAQQGYWQGQTNRLVFENNTIVSSSNTVGKGGGFYFGTLFLGDATGFRVRNNFVDNMLWSIAKQQLDFYNNVGRLMSQAAIDAMAWNSALDGDSYGLAGAALSTCLVDAPNGDFTAKAILQRADGSWAGARDNLGNYANRPPMV